MGSRLISSNLIPQANNPERLITLARHYARHGVRDLPEDFRHARDASFYRAGLRILGWLDKDGLPTEAGLSLPEGEPELRRTFLEALEASPIGAAWREHSGASTLATVDPEGIEQMLAARTTLSKKTRARRAGTLRRWLEWGLGEDQFKDVSEGGQLRLFQGVQVAHEWPEPSRFPHNEAGAAVGRIVVEDLSHEGDVLVVSGYASLDRLVRLLATRNHATGGTVRILLGNEPFPSRRDGSRIGGERLADEVRDYWLERGISVMLARDVTTAREALEHEAVEVRTAAPGRGVHAKVYCSDIAVTLGSSNYTAAGMGGQSEANARFTADDPARLAEARDLAEGLWERGVDYRVELSELLETLQRKVTWREALARACAEVLEGEWAKRYVPPGELDTLDPRLWPHQLQGISQAAWILHNVGSVLIADATGSGKTRMGAWLLRAAYDRLVRSGHGARVQPVVISPPAVVKAWEHWLGEAGLRWKVDSHGPLSNTSSQDHDGLLCAILETELLAVDEAHNFLNRSNRTDRLRAHYADSSLLFTATPINRGASDLLALVELLGPDHFSDEAIETLRRLMRLRRGARGGAGDAEREIMRGEIRRFMVRRTRDDLNRIVDESPESYRMGARPAARYPRHRARYYDVPATDEDLRLAGEIVRLADRLRGVARLGGKVELPRSLAIEGLTEEVYLERLVRSSAALARHFVLDCLRSSRAALYEHIRGTAAAVEHLALEVQTESKQATGNMVQTLEKHGGSVPAWKLAGSLKSEAPRWLWDPASHAGACEEEAETYREIAKLAALMSETREEAKEGHLAWLISQRDMLIAYDSHVLSLMLLEARLKKRGFLVRLFTGAGGPAAKRQAMRELGPDPLARRPRSPLREDAAPGVEGGLPGPIEKSGRNPAEEGGDDGASMSGKRMIALCTDAFSEAMNLQRASVVVHLDTPTVIRAAEQRAGRVDRMDSPHDEVEIWWPRDPAGFAPRRKDLLRERHELVSDLIGANLQMPEVQIPEEDDPDVLPVEELARAADIDRKEDPLTLYDAFRPVRDLVGADGLVDQEVYELMRASQARIVSCVSLVHSDHPWGFFAVGGLDRVAPRWIFLDGPHAEPLSDLGQVAARLTERLGPSVEDHPLDEAAEKSIATLAHRLRESEHLLLPVRRQRALALARRVLPEWRKAAHEAGDSERARLLSRVQRMTEAPSDDEPYPDPRSVADAWLRVVRPIQRRALSGRRRGRLWRLDDLYKTLSREPVETAALRQAFRAIPLLPPVSERVVAMIAGVGEAVPAEDGMGSTAR